MTALAAWCGPPAPPETDPSLANVTRLLASLALRGDRGTTQQPATGVALGAGVYEWQTQWVGTALGRCGPVWVVSDATIYYVDNLLLGLSNAGVAAASRRPADLIAGAIVAWGDDATARLEGDFAFVAFHDETRRVIGARDWGGLRSLCFASVGEVIAFSSEPAALAGVLGVGQKLNASWIAEAASGRFESLFETAFEGIEVVPAGHFVSATFDASGRMVGVDRVRQFELPAFLGEDRAELPFERAKVELRALMSAAVRERTPAEQASTVALSGGRDSAAVYALARESHRDLIQSVSVSFPVGDPGRDDEIIVDVLAQCGGSPNWIESRDIPVLGEIEAAAPARPDAFAHPFAEFQESLSRAARVLDTRVLLTGGGGDQLFSADVWYLTDLFWGGRLRTFVREWTLLEIGFDWRMAFTYLVAPKIGTSGRQAFSFLNRGRPWPVQLEQPLAPWIREDFARAANLDARHRANFPSRTLARSAADFERRWILTHPFFPRILSECYRLCLKEGVELRNPLSDSRLLRFAATRPRWERRIGRDVKILMRASLKDMLPKSVTGGRTGPMGTTDRLYFDSIRRRLPAWIDLINENAHLVTLGIVDVARFRRSADAIMNGDGLENASEVMYTILAEVWLRARLGRTFPVAPADGGFEIA